MKVYLPECVKTYYREAVDLHDLKRRERMTDTVLLGKLEILLKMIDTSGFSDAEETLHKAILDKYRC